MGEDIQCPGAGACYEAKNVVEAHNACAGDPYFPFLINSLDAWWQSTSVKGICQSLEGFKCHWNHVSHWLQVNH